MAEYENGADGSRRAGRAPKSGGSGRGIFRDPVVKWLALAAGGLVALYLLTVAAALMMGVLGDPTPKTRVQRDVAHYESVVEANPASSYAWHQYASALITSGEHSRAAQVLDRAASAVDETGNMDITTARAELAMAKGDYEAGIALCDTVIADLSAFHEKQKAIDDSEESRGKEINANYLGALLMKAEALNELSRTQEAIEALDKYLELKPAAADILARRGGFKAETGDVAGAEADLRAALRYLPGDEAVLEALDEIGVDAR